MADACLMHSWCTFDICLIDYWLSCWWIVDGCLIDFWLIFDGKKCIKHQAKSINNPSKIHQPSIKHPSTIHQHYYINIALQVHQQCITSASAHDVWGYGRCMFDGFVIDFRWICDGNKCIKNQSNINQNSIKNPSKFHQQKNMCFCMTPTVFSLCLLVLKLASKITP